MEHSFTFKNFFFRFLLSALIGHLQTTWTGFRTFLTTHPPHMDTQRHLNNHLPISTWAFHGPTLFYPYVPESLDFAHMSGKFGKSITNRNFSRKNNVIYVSCWVLLQLLEYVNDTRKFVFSNIIAVFVLHFVHVDI